MKYTVKLSYLQHEADTGFIYSTYIVTAKDLNTAKNKAIIKLIKECNPYHFIFNEAHFINPKSFNHRSETPLIV
jgi:hypothetical protein